MRGRPARRALVFAALVFLVLDAPTASARTRPPDGAVVSSPPLLRWTRVSGAKFYNVQLWRQGTRATRKILSRWPTRPRFQLEHRWRYRGHVRHFTPGRYYWYVWPWMGTHYGRLRVQRSFVSGTAPVNTSPPTIAGEAREGATLTATPGTWTGRPRPTTSYRWERCATDGSTCTTIVGATGPTYRIGADDIDLLVRAIVIGTNIVRAVAAVSPASEVVLPVPPSNVSPPGINGHPHVGARLTAAIGEWASSRTITYSFRWFRCSRDGTSCLPIPRAKAKTYEVRNADTGQRLEALVTAANSGGENKAASPHSARVGILLAGTAKADVVRGTTGSDLIRLHAGNDTAYGRRGDDHIYSGRGSDRISGGRGGDVIKTNDGSRDRVDCGRGADSVRGDRLDRISSNCESVTRV